jgi:hypothetical protein
VSGGRMVSFPIATSLSAGVYWVQLHMSTVNTSSVGTATTQLGNTISMMLGNLYTASGFANLGVANNNTSDVVQGRGVFGSVGFPATSASIPMNFINNQGGSKSQGNFPVLFRNY